jgi:hypothetical protein
MVVFFRVNGFNVIKHHDTPWSKPVDGWSASFAGTLINRMEHFNAIKSPPYFDHQFGAGYWLIRV